MKLNTIEFLAMNNPIRRLAQEKYEVRILKKMTSKENLFKASHVGGLSTNGVKFSRVSIAELIQ